MFNGDAISPNTLFGKGAYRLQTPKLLAAYVGILFDADTSLTSSSSISALSITACVSIEAEAAWNQINKSYNAALAAETL